MLTKSFTIAVSEPHNEDNEKKTMDLVIILKLSKSIRSPAHVFKASSQRKENSIESVVFTVRILELSRVIQLTIFPHMP